MIIFDCDGVLIDSELIGCRVWSECLKPYADVSVEAMLGFTGKTGTLICRQIEEEYRCRLPEHFLDEVNVAVEDLMDRILQPVSGVLETLPRLNLPMCIASGSRPERLMKCIRKTRMENFFSVDNTFSSYLVKNGKPAPDIFLYAAEKTGFSPSDCLVVEDSVSGIVGAKAAGMTAFGFVGASHCTPERAASLADAGADLIFDDFTRLPELLSCRNTG